LFVVNAGSWYIQNVTDADAADAGIADPALRYSLVWLPFAAV
jgi:hypothetical protein